MAFPALGRNSKGWQVEDAVNRILRWLNPGFGASNAGKVLTSNSTGTDLEWKALPSQTLLQMVSFETGALATGTTLIPADDTIPQNTEGDQYMSLSITPKSATSNLLIDVVWNGANSNSNAGNVIIVALFQDSVADALAASWVGSSTANFATSNSFRHTMTAGTTAATTFKVRAGSYLPGTTTFNGNGGLRFFGGVMASSIVICEYA